MIGSRHETHQPLVIWIAALLAKDAGLLMCGSNKWLIVSLLQLFVFAVVGAEKAAVWGSRTSSRCCCRTTSLLQSHFIAREPRVWAQSIHQLIDQSINQFWMCKINMGHAHCCITTFLHVCVTSRFVILLLWFLFLQTLLWLLHIYTQLYIHIYYSSKNGLF